MADTPFSGEVQEGNQEEAQVDIGHGGFVQEGNQLVAQIDVGHGGLVQEGNQLETVAESAHDVDFSGEVQEGNQIVFVTDHPFSGLVQEGNQLELNFDIGFNGTVQEGNQIISAVIPSVRWAPPTEADCEESDPFAGDVVFYGPWDTLEYVYRIKAPQIGNVERVITGAQIAYSRNNTRWSFKRGARRRLLLTWENIRRSLARLLMDFFDYTAAQDIRFDDTEGNVWRGQIVNEEIDFETTDRGGLTTFSVEFEGEKIE